MARGETAIHPTLALSAYGGEITLFPEEARVDERSGNGEETVIDGERGEDEEEEDGEVVDLDGHGDSGLLWLRSALGQLVLGKY